MSNWLFATTRLDDASCFFDANGFVGFMNLLAPETFARLRGGVEEAVGAGSLTIGEAEMASNNDCVFAHETILEVMRDRVITEIASHLIGQPIELQHSKFNAKPQSHVGGAVRWHQDFPFYPHTNFDLISCVVHLDDEDEDTGPLRMINGSHRWGPQSHLDGGGAFAYECTGRDRLDEEPSTLLMGQAGLVTFHHVLTMHSSQPKRRSGHRRLLIFQYRAVDAVQLAGVVWRCHGMQVADAVPGPRYARFADGPPIELRGSEGRLIDLFGQFGPALPLKGS